MKNIKMSGIIAIQEYLDENKETIKDGVYKNLCDMLMKEYKKREPVNQQENEEKSLLLVTYINILQQNIDDYERKLGIEIEKNRILQKKNRDKNKKIKNLIIILENQEEYKEQPEINQNKKEHKKNPENNQNNERIHCEICNCDLAKKYFSTHKKTKKHINNMNNQ